MSEKLCEKSCEDFAAALASSAPVPGGGGAAALCGALAVSLCSMAGRLSAGRKKNAEDKAAVEALVQRADALRLRLLALVEEDAAGFAPLAAAYAIPKDNPDRAAVLREATLGACKAPVEIVERCGEAAELLEEMGRLASPLLLSDVGCGAALCRAAMESALFNVLVNTRSLPGDAEAEQWSRRARQTIEKEHARLETLARSVREALEH